MWRLWFPVLTHICSPSQKAQAPVLLIFRHVTVQEDGEVLEGICLAERVWVLVVRES